MEKQKSQSGPPKMNPYIFTGLLLAGGLWCLYDGWFNPEMADHAMLNRVIGMILLPWGVYDFFKIKKRQKNK